MCGWVQAKDTGLALQALQEEYWKLTGHRSNILLVCMLNWNIIGGHLYSSLTHIPWCLGSTYLQVSSIVDFHAGKKANIWAYNVHFRHSGCHRHGQGWCQLTPNCWRANWNGITLTMLICPRDHDVTILRSRKELYKVLSRHHTISARRMCFKSSTWCDARLFKVSCFIA